MDLTSSQQTTGSNSRECRGWGDEINGNLIRFANKICKCNRRASVKISKSDDNPNKLYYCCMDSWTADMPAATSRRVSKETKTYNFIEEDIIFHGS
ncbi:hypothetical protein WN944_003081 [Citrus x changshan-huyou]|uniref:Uncharacterized protein n=1 Tax=Citrus x changshan-huyou TaxID=2935761 RepID=A0AAP0QKT1_9ROSI